MALGLVGGNLTDLGRNLIANDQVVGNEFAQADLRTVQREADRMRNNQFLQELALRQRSLDAESAYRNNALAQQKALAEMQHREPNATAQYGIDVNREIARGPWDWGITPAQQAEIDLRREALNAAQDRYSNALLDFGKLGTSDKVPLGIIGTPAGKMITDDILARRQSDARRQRALAVANQQLAAQGHRWFSTDSGQAQGILRNLIMTYPEAADLVFDPDNFRFVLPSIPAQDTPQESQQPQPSPQPKPMPSQWPSVDMSKAINPSAYFRQSPAPNGLVPGASMMPPGPTVRQNGVLYRVNPDGSLTEIGPAQ
jgi:hypothetical protein